MITKYDLAKYDFQNLFKQKGYAYFTKGLYNLNIIGIRTNHGNDVTNMYDDFLVLIFNAKDCYGNINEHRKVYSITTEPGTYYMLKPMNSKGTAILVPGQYRGCWQLAKHKGKYLALCQRKAIKVYRDNNKDKIYDLNQKTIDTGIFGVNIHRSNEFRTRDTVDNYSAGCQVFNNPSEFNSFIGYCKKQKELYGNSFTYTLITEDDLNLK